MKRTVKENQDIQKQFFEKFGNDGHGLILSDLAVKHDCSIIDVMEKSLKQGKIVV